MAGNRSRFVGGVDLSCVLTYIRPKVTVDTGSSDFLIPRGCFPPFFFLLLHMIKNSAARLVSGDSLPNTTILHKKRFHVGSFIARLVLRCATSRFGPEKEEARFLLCSNLFQVTYGGSLTENATAVKDVVSFGNGWTGTASFGATYNVIQQQRRRRAHIRQDLSDYPEGIMGLAFSS